MSLFDSAKWDRKKGRPEPISALNKILEQENGEEFVDLRLIAPNAVVDKEHIIPYCRVTVAEMLHSATEKIPDYLHLAVTEAWRPISRQKGIYNKMMELVEEKYPKAPYALKKRMVNRFVAPYDQKAPPGHCTGAALDVWLVDQNYERIDVSSPYTFAQSAATYSLGLSQDAQKNREILVNAMLDSGFSNCRDEFWHYSYGDAGWAVRIGESQCFYGMVNLPDNQYAHHEKIWWEKHLPHLFDIIHKEM